MKVEQVKARIGQKVLLILKNNCSYTITIPDFQGSSFSTTDKFGKELDVECDMIGFLTEIGEKIDFLTEKGGNNER